MKTKELMTLLQKMPPNTHLAFALPRGEDHPPKSLAFCMGKLPGGEDFAVIAASSDAAKAEAASIAEMDDNSKRSYFGLGSGAPAAAEPQARLESEDEPDAVEPVSDPVADEDEKPRRGSVLSGFGRKGQDTDDGE